MIKKLATLAIGSMALFTAQAAGATTYSPANSTWVFSGAVDVYKGISLTCNLTLTVNVDAAGTGATATPALSGGTLGLCSTITFSNTPYTVSYSGGVLTLHNVYADTITSGDCAGNISASWDDSTNTIDIVNAVLPEVDAGTGDCIINGPITLTSPADVTIT